MKTQKKPDRNTKLNLAASLNLAAKVNKLVAGAEQFALKAGVSADALRAQRFEADALRAQRFEKELDALFQNQETLNAELLAPRNEQLPSSSQVIKKRVAFAEDTPKLFPEQRSALRTYTAERQECERSLSQDFTPAIQRRIVRTNDSANHRQSGQHDIEDGAYIRRSTSPSFTLSYSNNQTEDINKRVIFMMVSLLIALFLFFVANNGLQNNSTAPKLKP